MLTKYLEEFEKKTEQEIFQQRKEKFLNIGKHKTFKVFHKEVSWLEKAGFFAFLSKNFFRFKKELVIGILLVSLGLLFLF